MNPALVLAGLAAVGAFAFVAHEKSASASTGPGLAIGHVYKITFNADQVSRNAPSLAAQQSLVSALGKLGWTRVVLEPNPADQNLFTWRAQGTWDGSQPALRDGLGIRFVATLDTSAVIANATNAAMGGGGGIATGKYDRDLPPELELTVDRMLASENDPNELQKFSASMRPRYPIAASALDAKIAVLTGGRGIANAAAAAAPGARIALPPAPPPLAASYAPQPSGETFNPGKLPALPPIPPAGHTATQQHREGQAALADWAARYQPGSFAMADVDGKIGPRTQHVTQVFQAWSNQNQRTNLTLDGLFGPNTYAALQSAGYLR